jgi:asparagine synthase (glutamine-hydrolysing)
MIGIFGKFNSDSMQPASLAAMENAISEERYHIKFRSGNGASLANVLHKRGCGGSCLTSPDGALTVFVNGEIFNTDEVLGESDSTAAIDAATLIAKLYRSDNLENLSQANGLFSAAIYDEFAHKLVLVTDRYCGYPVHYTDTEKSLVFSGQILPLLAEGSIPRKADPLGIAELFTMQRTVGEGTNISGVNAMPAATILTRDKTGLHQRQYWNLAWVKGFTDERECADAMATALRAAVDRQTSFGCKSPGLLLSGGLDSRMVLSASPRDRLSSWTTASFSENPELELARQTAEKCGSPFTPLIVEPSDTLSFLDQTTIDSNGFYPASTQVSSFMPAVAEGCDVALTGHGLDYTFRGYYLPARFLRVAGSSTRLPTLRPIPARPTGADLLRNLRQGPPLSTIERIVRKDRYELWWRGQEDHLDQVLEPWLQGENPVNAWDAFILHSLSKHYAFTSMMAVRALVHLRIPTYDRDVFDVYLKMPPEWRIKGAAVLGALNALSPDLAKLSNANTGFRANLGPWAEILALLFRATGRRLHLAPRPYVPTAMHSAGSWQDIGTLYRDDCAHRDHFLAIRDRLDSLTLDILDADGMASCIDEHLSGSAKHTKLLRHLMTHDAWVRRFGIA